LRSGPSRILGALLFVMLVALVGTLSLVIGALLTPAPSPTSVIIAFPVPIEVTGQDVDQLQRAVSAIISHHQVPGRKLWIADWDQQGPTFRMQVQSSAEQGSQ